MVRFGKIKIFKLRSCYQSHKRDSNMRSNGTVRGTQAVKPACIEINGDTVSIRGDIVRKSDKREGRTEEFWEYTENILTGTEYEAIRASAPHVSIPDDAWNDGLQTMMRTILYEKTDGDRAKAERNIRLGVDIEANTAKRDAIDAYCRKVELTKTASGYPKNVPVYPEADY